MTCAAVRSEWKSAGFEDDYQEEGYKNDGPTSSARFISPFWKILRMFSNWKRDSNSRSKMTSSSPPHGPDQFRRRQQKRRGDRRLQDRQAEEACRRKKDIQLSIYSLAAKKKFSS